MVQCVNHHHIWLVNIYNKHHISIQGFVDVLMYIFNFKLVTGLV